MVEEEKKEKFRAYICFDSQSSFGTDEEKKKLAVKFFFSLVLLSPFFDQLSREIASLLFNTAVHMEEDKK